MRGNPRDQFVHCLLQLRFRHESRDQAQFQRALGGNRFARQDDLERSFRTYKEWQDRGRQGREHSDRNFWLSEARLGRGDYDIAEGGKLRAPANRRAIYDAHNRLADFQHPGERGVERVEHLVDTLGGVLANIDAAGKNFAGRVQYDQLDIISLTRENDAIRDLAKHALVQEIMVW